MKNERRVNLKISLGCHYHFHLARFEMINFQRNHFEREEGNYERFLESLWLIGVGCKSDEMLFWVEAVIGGSFDGFRDGRI